MALDDAINRVERRLTDDRAGWNEQNADQLRDEQAEREAVQAFEEAVETQIMPVFRRATARLTGLRVERLYDRDIQLALYDETQRRPKQSLWYSRADQGKVMTAKLTMDGNAEHPQTLPISELTHEKVEAHLEDFLNWSIRS